MLVSASVAWQSGQMAVSGSMNRSAGITEERIDAYGDNLSLHIENCTRGTCARDKQCRPWHRTTGSRCWRAGFRGDARSLVWAG